ncbi:MAG: PDZ domain-containing protein [Akkermansiaceae bacterium]|nr:PDZ domain-containing protein [Akkermansiaceae bacterium]
MKTTTNLITCVKGLAGIAFVALALPVAAIENPAPEEAPKAKGNPEAAAEEAPKENKKAAKKLAMIGLGGAPASETLSLHLGLEEGNGLTIYHVVPGSAAAKAGIESHDVLTEFDGKKIGSQQDLRDAVSARQPGDEVTLKYIHKGKAEEKKVALGERTDMPQMIPGAGNPWLQGMGDIPEADRKRMQEQMQKHIEEMRKQLEKNGGMQFDLGGLLDGAVPGKAAPNGGDKPKAGKQLKKFNFNAAASITMMDNDGSVTMKTIDGKREVIVKDKAGNIQFEGPYETEQDKAAVPDDVRDRLDRLNFGEDGKNGFRLQILPGGMVPPPVQPDENGAAE